MDAKQAQAILLLSTGKSNKETALEIGVSLSTVEKWKQKADFQQLLLRAIEQIYIQSIAQLTSGAVEAAQELRRIIADPDVSDRVRISAIALLFGQLERFKSWQLEQRLEKVEGLLNGADHSENSED